MTREMAEDRLQEELETRYREFFARNTPKPEPTRQQVLVKALGKLSCPPWCFGEAKLTNGARSERRVSVAR